MTTIPRELSQEIFETMANKDVLSVYPPPIRHVTEALDETNYDLPGYVYRDMLNRDEPGRLLKSYLRFDGFASPFINSYNQMLTKIQEYLLNHFSIQLHKDSQGRESSVHIIEVSMSRPMYSKGKPIYPHTAELVKDTYFSSTEVTMLRKYTDGSASDTVKNVPFGGIPIMTGSILCNLNEDVLLNNYAKDHNVPVETTPERRYAQYNLAMHTVGESMHDPLGWFMVEGTIKNIQTQGKLRVNVPLHTMAPNTKGGTIVKMTCTTLTQSMVIDLVRGKRKKTVLSGKMYSRAHPSYKFAVPGLDKSMSNKTNRKHLHIVFMFHLFGVTSASDMKERMRRVIRPDWRNLVPDDAFFTTKVNQIVYKHRSMTQYLRNKRPVDENENKTDAQLYEETRNNIFIHMNSLDYTKEEINDMKIDLFCFMAARMILFDAGKTKIDDRDSWSHKKLETGGRALLTQYIAAVSRFIETTNEIVARQRISSLSMLVQQMSADSIGADMTQLIHGNVFAIRANSKMQSTGYKLNVTEIMKRDSLALMYSQIRKLNTPVNRQSRQTDTRQVHASQFMVVCPTESPEGARIGLVNNVAITCSPTLEYPDAPIILDIINNFQSKIIPVSGSITNAKNTINSKELKYHDRLIGWISPEQGIWDGASGISRVPTYSHTHKLIINGRFLGWVPVDLYLWGKERKIANIWPRETCVVFDEVEEVVYIYTDGQRPMFPLLRVVNNQLIMDSFAPADRTYQKLLLGGAIELIDSWEMEFIQLAHDRDHLVVRNKEHVDKKEELLNRISTTTNATVRDGYARELKLLEKYWYLTHMALDPCSLSSVSTNLIPNYTRAAAARNTYEASMSKQALGIWRTNTLTQFNTTSRTLVHPNKPIFKTHMDEDIGHDDMPHGANAIVAIMPFKGSNIEDAFIMNRDSLDKFASIKEISKTIILDSVNDHFGISPEINPQLRASRYAHIDPTTGVPLLGVVLKSEDILVARYTKNKDGTIVDKSVRMGVGESGTVSVVFITNRTNTGRVTKRMVRVKLYEYRTPTQGDKFTSRYAQKATIGLIIPSVDLPRTLGRGSLTPVVPDIIINSLPMSNRMTINKTFEMFGSKPAAMQGIYLNGTAHRTYDVDAMMEYMQSQGFDKHGLEEMIDGETGEMIKSRIFIGPCYYQKLRHEVRDRIQQRAQGKRMKGTGQPTRGRADGGAIRHGVMEKTALESYGASELLKERLMYSSDALRHVSCTKCNTTATTRLMGGERAKSPYVCPLKCENATFTVTTIPHALNYAKYILAAGNFALNFKVKPSVAQESTEVEVDDEVEDIISENVLDENGEPVEQDSANIASDEEDEDEDEDEDDESEDEGF